MQKEPNEDVKKFIVYFTNLVLIELSKQNEECTDVFELIL